MAEITSLSQRNLPSPSQPRPVRVEQKPIQPIENRTVQSVVSGVDARDQRIQKAQNDADDMAANGYAVEYGYETEKSKSVVSSAEGEEVFNVGKSEQERLAKFADAKIASYPARLAQRLKLITDRATLDYSTVRFSSEARAKKYIQSRDHAALSAQQIGGIVDASGDVDLMYGRVQVFGDTLDTFTQEKLGVKYNEALRESKAAKDIRYADIMKGVSLAIKEAIKYQSTKGDVAQIDKILGKMGHLIVGQDKAEIETLRSKAEQKGEDTAVLQLVIAAEQAANGNDLTGLKYIQDNAVSDKVGLRASSEYRAKVDWKNREKENTEKEANKAAVKEYMDTGLVSKETYDRMNPEKALELKTAIGNKKFQVTDPQVYRDHKKNLSSRDEQTQRLAAEVDYKNDWRLAPADAKELQDQADRIKNRANDYKSSLKHMTDTQMYGPVVSEVAKQYGWTENMQEYARLTAYANSIHGSILKDIEDDKITDINQARTEFRKRLYGSIQFEADEGWFSTSYEPTLPEVRPLVLEPGQESTPRETVKPDDRFAGPPVTTVAPPPADPRSGVNPQSVEYIQKKYPKLTPAQMDAYIIQLKGKGYDMSGPIPKAPKGQ